MIPRMPGGNWISAVRCRREHNTMPLNTPSSSLIDSIKERQHALAARIPLPQITRARRRDIRHFYADAAVAAFVGAASTAVLPSIPASA
jgi:hypothetical protein